jgi:hypothetical protein
MRDSQEDLRRAVREMSLELGRAVERCGRVVREAARDVGSRGPDPRGPDPRGRRAEPSGSAGSPVEAIRQLGELRDAGLVTEEEFQTKKAELLERI